MSSWIGQYLLGHRNILVNRVMPRAVGYRGAQPSPAARPRPPGEDGDWGHTSIRLEPLNPAHEPLVLTPDSEGEVRVLGEWVRNL